MGDVRMEFFLKILWSMEIFIFAWGIVQMEFCKNKAKIVFGIIILLLAKCFYVYFPNTLLGAVVGGVIVPMICFIIVFEGKNQRKVIRFFFCLTYVELIYLPINMLFVIIDVMEIKNLDAYIIDVAKSIVVICVILCLSHFIKKKKDLVFWIKELTDGYFCIALICAVAVSGINSYADVIMEYAGKKVRILFECLSLILNVFIYFLGMGFAFSDFLRNKYREENELKDQYLRISKDYYTGMVMHMQEVRKIKHDMQAHISILNKYACDENLPLLKTYLSELTEQHMSHNYRVVNTGNELVNAIITDCINKKMKKV